MARFLQHGPKRFVLQAFRGVGKSWVTSAYVLWLLYCNPQLKILVVSASKERADNFTTFTLRLINEIEVLQFLRPRDEQRNSKVSFDVGPATPDHAPSVKSVGITGQLTGSRADYILADDIEVANNSDTPTKRDKLAEAVKEFDAILKPLPHARIGYLGTPQTEHSIYNALPERGYVIRIWPARYPTSDKRVKYGPHLAPFIANALDADPSLGAMPGDPSRGRPTDPQRFTHEDLIEREMSYGRSGFALQFQLDTSLSDADRYPLRLSDLVVMPLDPFKGPSDLAWASSVDLVYENLPTVGLNGDFYYRPIFVSKDFVEYEGSVMFVDPSGKGKDETAYAIVKMLHGRLFLVDVSAFAGGYDEETVLKPILMAARRHHANLIRVEPNFGGGMFTQLLRAASQKYYPVTIEDADWATTQKEQRIIDTLEPVMNQHRLVVSPEVIEKDFKSTEKRRAEDVQAYRLFYQMTRITRDRGALKVDDRLDAVAGAVAYWVDYMNRDSEKAALAHKDKLIDEQLERFMQHVLGGNGEGMDPRLFASSIMRGDR